MIQRIDKQQYRNIRLWKFINNCLKDIDKKIKILDVGCGHGTLLNLFYKGGFRNLYGCDIFERNTNNYHFDVVDLNIEGLPYNNAEFDLVICSDVLEHLENSSNILREIRRITKNNGYLFLTIPNCANILQRVYYLLYGNVKRFNPKTDMIRPHITMISSWVFEYLIQDKYKIIKRGGDGFIINSYLVSFIPPKPIFSFTLFFCLQAV